MAQPTSNPKIEELRFRVKTDARSRLFYPLAEELRKVSRLAEAEQVLRTGLEHHPTYLSAWVGLGRVLRDQKKNDGAAEALKKALQLDPGNVVAARLLADAYLDLGDKVEAIKKYKLVQALLPGDEELDAKIEQLDRDLNPLVPVNEQTAFAEPPPPAAGEETPFATPKPSLDETHPQPRPEPSFAVAAARLEVERQATIESPFGEAERAMVPEQKQDAATGDDQPMSAAHAESPFESTAAGYTAAAVTVERPMGIHVEPAPPGDEVAPWEETAPAAWDAPSDPSRVEPADVFAPTEPVAAGSGDDVANTLTMADLYVKQGLADEARRIYESILQRDPDNRQVRERLDALAPPPRAGTPAASRDPKVSRLESWLAKVRKEQERV